MPCQTKLLQTRRCAPQQIELFVRGSWTTGVTDGMPAWSRLPMQTQAALIALMTRLMLDHADKSQLGSTTGADHDL